MLADRPFASRHGARWRRSVVAAAAGALVLMTGLTPASAAPSTPAQASGDSLAALQQRAKEVQQRFMDAAVAYEGAEMRVAQERAKAEEARNAETAARAEASLQQHMLGQYASQMYQMNLVERHPMLKTVVYGPEMSAELLHEQGLMDLVGRNQDEQVQAAAAASARAQELARTAAEAEKAAEEASADARRMLDEIQVEASKVSTELNDQLSSMGLAAANAEQEARNQAALKNWREYLAKISAAGIVPPSAAALADPAHLPPGMAPVVNKAGQAMRGVASVTINGVPTTILSAETVSAVSNGFSQMGRPYVPGQAGPDTYDCAGFTASTWSKVGYSVGGTVADQWTRGAPVAAEDAQVGDLLFFTAPGSGLQHVGLYLGGGRLLSASAARYQVAVEEVPDGLFAAVRATLPAPVEPNAAPAAGAGGVKMVCGAVDAPVSGAGWGGFPNGMIPEAALCRVASVHLLRCDAATAYTAMAAAFQAANGVPLCITDSYRSFALQVTTYQRKPTLAAVPGTSNHGWALAVDLCGGIESFSAPAHQWMQANAGRFGFVNPPWAQASGEKPEPWHWEFGRIS